MPFDLLLNNLSGAAVIEQPGGLIPGSNNWIDPYNYSMQYQPDLLAKMHFANGRGKLFKFVQLMAKRGTYASDLVRHSEMGRLQNKLKGVNCAVNTFSFTPTATQTKHNVRVNDTVLIFTGTAEFQATVTSVTNDTTFVATNDAAPGTPFGTLTNVDIVVDFSNSFAKGADGFAQGRTWSPKFFDNYSHIIKEHYNVNNSDMAHISWIKTPAGDMWWSLDMENTEILYDNKIEFTHLYHRRKATGENRGMNGLVPTIETRGNVANGYIETIDDLTDIIWRYKRQGIKVKEFTIWGDYFQMTKLREMCSGVNSYYAGGANYGMFNNKRENAIALGFTSIHIDGITFHFQELEILNDPTMLGTDRAMTTSLACLIIPGGGTTATIDGVATSVPYLEVKHRAYGATNRLRTVIIKGDNYADKQDGSKDITTADFKSEQTQRVVGANAFTVVRRTA
jgi:hypothetical protein